MLELYQTEWRPASRRVRERLTELGLDYLMKAERVRRRSLEEECTHLLRAEENP